MNFFFKRISFEARIDNININFRQFRSISYSLLYYFINIDFGATQQNIYSVTSMQTIVYCRETAEMHRIVLLTKYSKHIAHALNVIYFSHNQKIVSLTVRNIHIAIIFFYINLSHQLEVSLEFMDDIILRSSLSPDRSINVATYNRFNQYGALHLSLI